MRDLLIVSIVFAAALIALARPWVGVLSWTWLSIMNPHRYAYGFAYSAPLAAVAAGSTLVGILFTREKSSPFKGAAVFWFVAFMLWMTLTWLLGLSVEDDYAQWSKVMKIDFMILVALTLMRTKQHVFGMIWVAAGSLALLGLKGGAFTLLTGGGDRVWGPPGSFIADNNEFALALVLTIPLLRFLQMQVQLQWQKLALLGAMVLCAFAAFGSHSRGALLAILAMGAVLWWRSSRKAVVGVVLLLLGIGLLAFMPENWTLRMQSIDNYAEDASALGRISAWWNAWGIAMNYPFGVGFNQVRAELFARFSPYPDRLHAAHSIYFQVLGNHGFVGLFLFLGIWVSTWLTANWLRTNGTQRIETKWCADLGAMSQVALAGYAVGGAFLSLSYFDLPYNIMAVVVVTRVWLLKEAWRHEPAGSGRCWSLPGVALPRRRPR